MSSQQRVRFDEFGLERLPSGRCIARVRLRFQELDRFDGTSEGLASPAGELRCSAQACVTALQEYVGATPAFELLGVKAVRAFDATVVIVSIAVRGDSAGGNRLVGSVLIDDGDVARGAALAVLNATNRLLGNRVSMR
jgi:hypothetical protein